VEVFVNVCYYFSMCVFAVGIVGFTVWDNVTLSCCGWRTVAEDRDQGPEKSRESASNLLIAEGAPSG
jgi:hypothetical protein